VQQINNGGNVSAHDKHAQMCKLWSFVSLGRKSLTHQYSATRISYLQFMFKCRGPQHGDPGSPSNTMWPGPMPTFVLSAILINPALWPQRTWGENRGTPIFATLPQAAHPVFTVALCNRADHYIFAL